jgi:DNA-binding transcriptional LysR family regulator
LRHLKYVVATVDACSFSAAAASLNVKQATLRRKIMDLEVGLGIKLFERSTRGAALTDQGKVFAEQARRIVTDAENLQTTARAMKYGEQGRLAIGYCSSLMAGNLRSAYTDFLNRYPHVQFDGIEAGPESLIHQLETRTIDAAVLPIGMQGNAISCRPLWSERLMVVLPEGHELIAKDDIHWPHLRREVFVVPSGGLGPIIGSLISARLTQQGYRPNIIYQDTGLESVIIMIAAKRYISVVTEASQGVIWPELHFREIFDANGPARLDYALYWREENDNPALKRFFKLIEERYPG